VNVERKLIGDPDRIDGPSLPTIRRHQIGPSDQNGCGLARGR